MLLGRPLGRYHNWAGVFTRRPRSPSPRGPSRAGRPTGARSAPVAKLFAVYQFGWRDRTESAIPLGDGVAAPERALIGLCRDRAKADRIAVRIRRAAREALARGARPREPLIG